MRGSAKGLRNMRSAEPTEPASSLGLGRKSSRGPACIVCDSERAYGGGTSGHGGASCLGSLFAFGLGARELNNMYGEEVPYLPQMGATAKGIDAAAWRAAPMVVWRGNDRQMGVGT